MVLLHCNKPEQYPNRVKQEHTYCSTASELGQHPGGVARFTSLHRKPFYSFTFLFLFKRNVHRYLFIFGEEEGP